MRQRFSVLEFDYPAKALTDDAEMLSAIKKLSTPQLSRQQRG